MTAENSGEVHVAKECAKRGTGSHKGCPLIYVWTKDGLAEKLTCSHWTACMEWSAAFHRFICTNLTRQIAHMHKIIAMQHIVKH